MRKIPNNELGRPSIEEFARMPKCPVIAVLDNVRSLNNVGSFFRTCDAFAVEKLFLCGITATPPHRDIHKTALGAELTVPWEYISDTTEAVHRLRKEGRTVLAVEQTEGARLLGEWQMESGRRYALVFGNEVSGVQQSVVDLCDGAVEVPQSGTKHSINVSVCGGVVLWETYRQWRTLCGE